MQKTSLLFVLSFVFADALQAQNGYSVKPYYVNLSVRKKDKITVREFGNVVLQDCRRDTADMGATLVNIKEGYSRLRFEDGLVPALNKGLNKMIIPGISSDTLYINVNDFWFQEATVVSGWFHAAMFNSTRLESRLYLNADLYISSKGAIRKTGNIDTLFRRNRWMPDNCDQLAESAAKSLLLAAQAYNDGLQETISRDDFAARSKHGVWPSILRDSTFKKGIYFSFEQFMDNDPTDIEFKAKHLRKSTMLSYKPAGDTTLDEAWGFSDGKSVYIHLDTSYYKLQKRGNKFYTSAPLSIELINSFATRAVKRALNTTIFLYFLYTNPFTIFSIPSAIRPYAVREEFFRYYELNLCNGTLR